MVLDDVADEVLGAELSENYKYIAMVLGIGVVAGIVGLFLLPSFIALLVGILIIVLSIFVARRFTIKLVGMIVGLVLVGTGVVTWVLYNALHGFTTPEQLTQYGGLWSLLSIPFSIQTKFNEFIYSIPAGSTLIGAGIFSKIGLGTKEEVATPTIAPSDISYSWADIA